MLNSVCVPRISSWPPSLGRLRIRAGAVCHHVGLCRDAVSSGIYLCAAHLSKGLCPSQRGLEQDCKGGLEGTVTLQMPCMRLVHRRHRLSQTKSTISRKAFRTTTSRAAISANAELLARCATLFIGRHARVRQTFIRLGSSRNATALRRALPRAGPLPFHEACLHHCSRFLRNLGLSLSKTAWLIGSLPPGRATATAEPGCCFVSSASPVPTGVGTGELPERGPSAQIFWGRDQVRRLGCGAMAWALEAINHISLDARNTYDPARESGGDACSHG